MYLLGKTGYIIIAIVILVLLVVVFFLTYILNKRTPVPKGCENLVDSEKCASCSNTNCKLYKLKDDLEEAKKEIKEW